MLAGPNHNETQVLYFEWPFAGVTRSGVPAKRSISYHFAIYAHVRETAARNSGSKSIAKGTYYAT